LEIQGWIDLKRGADWLPFFIGTNTFHTSFLFSVD
jgi:hypothetical protein